MVNELSEQTGAGDHPGDLDVLGVRVRATAHGAQAVQRRAARSRGVVAVRGAADGDAPQRFLAQFRGDSGGEANSSADDSGFIGGLRLPPSTSGRAPGSRATSPHMNVSIRSCASRVGTRTSTDTFASAGTVLRVVPAATRVVVMVGARRTGQAAPVVPVELARSATAGTW
ncbi:hypothetical protein M877_00130 [Streptomyces niveus NCIMB 11891]|nr:hypothetical protein M877_00130 [Streptomyces niveus NCIMB 11891]